ncbi:MAG: NAD(P)/FAD-dependent oxidoreductase [Marinobacter sp.]|nr:NAD(P)/FAD-dependent oxidoreductase [Marinobacter sp.]
MSDTPINAEPLHQRVIIIGSGFGGIGMGVALKKQGIENFLMLEKAADVGGVWRDNSYPGAACDVPSHLYSFSFEPNPAWSHVFAPQHEIYQYLRHCAAKYGLRPHLRFGTEVAEANYEESARRWVLKLTDGRQLTTDILITATGQLSRPALPKIEGMDTFKGHSFHSAHWDHNYPLEGKRVAVIGTGASAIQFVPAIADKVRHMTVFQRSPAYILPRPDRPYSAVERGLFKRLPAVGKLYRAGIYLQYESRAIAFTRFHSLMKPMGVLPFRRLLKRQVPDAGLQEKLVPDYPIGCKRILLSSEYLATLARPQVELVTDPITRITEQGVQTADGTCHEVDTLIYGTGFAATEFLAPMTIRGRDGQSLNEAWQQGAKAFLGLSVPGFPNFFMLYGPNTNLGHNSIVYMLESQITHVIKCLKLLDQQGASVIEVDAQQHTDFNQGIQARLSDSVWSGCQSWYVDANGHNSTNWPGFTLSYRWLVNRRLQDAYHLAS